MIIPCKCQKRCLHLPSWQNDIDFLQGIFTNYCPLFSLLLRLRCVVVNPSSSMVSSKKFCGLWLNIVETLHEISFGVHFGWQSTTTEPITHAQLFHVNFSCRILCTHSVELYTVSVTLCIFTWRTSIIIPLNLLTISLVVTSNEHPEHASSCIIPGLNLSVQK